MLRRKIHDIVQHLHTVGHLVTFDMNTGNIVLVRLKIIIYHVT